MGGRRKNIFLLEKYSLREDLLFPIGILECMVMI